MLGMEKVKKTPKKQPPSESIGQELCMHASSPGTRPKSPDTTPACPYSDSNTKATNTLCRLGQAAGEGLPDIGVKLEFVDLEEKADVCHRKKIRPFGSQKKHEKDLTLQRSNPYPLPRETFVSLPDLNQISLEKQAKSALDSPAQSRKRKSHSLNRPDFYLVTSHAKCPNNPGQSKLKGDSGTHGHKQVPRQEHPVQPARGTASRLKACRWREGEKAGKITIGCVPASAQGQPVPQAPQVVGRDRLDRLEVSQSREQEEMRQADTLRNHLVSNLQHLKKLKKKHLLPSRREKVGSQLSHQESARLEKHVRAVKSGGQGLDSTPHSLGPLHTLDSKPNLDIRQFFIVDLKKACRILCILCHTGVRQGKTTGWSRVSGLVHHLASKHGLEWERKQGTWARGAEQAQLMPTGTSLFAKKHVDIASSEDSNKEAPQSDPEQLFSLSALPSLPASFEAVRDSQGGSHAASQPCTPAWNHSITELLCSLALPLSFVSSQPFKRFLAQVDPCYRLPSPGFFSDKALPLLHEAMGEQVLQEMQWAEGGHVHFSFFMSAQDSAVTYVAISAHWVSTWSPGRPVTSEGMRKQAVLWVRGLPAERVSEDQQRELLEQISLWLDRGSLKAGFLVAGGWPSLEQMVRTEGYIHIPCFAHCLDSLVNSFLGHHNSIQIILSTARAIFSHFQGSPEARHLLGQIQAQLGLPSQLPFEELSDHWVSAYHLMEWITEQKQALQAYAEKQQSGKASTPLSTMFWSLTDSLVKLLQPFQMVLREASTAQASLSQVLPQLRYLHIFLEQVHRHFTEQSGGEVAVALRLAEGLSLQLSTDCQLNELFHREEFVLATLLDPRFKGKVEAILPMGADIDHWKQVLVYKVKEIMVSEGGQAFSRLKSPRGVSRISRSLGAKGRGQREPVQGVGDSSSFLLVQREKNLLERLESVGLLASERNGASLSTENHLASVIVRKYLRENETIGAQEDPLAYWEKKRETWPALAHLATIYLSCPPTGTFSKRVLASLNSPTITESNPPLKVETVEHLLFLKTNLESFPHYTPPPLTSSPGLPEREQTL